MKILAFDTCLDKMYVTVGEDESVLDSKVVETTESHYHSAFLISTIKNILTENSLLPSDINVIAINRGPGSFTGIRACTTVARVFAQANDLETVGVSSLEILSRINKSDKMTIVALDARKEMAYYAVYDGKTQLVEPKTILLTELKAILDKGDYFVITDDKLKPLLGGISYQESDDDLGKFLLEIASEKLNSDYDTNWRKLLPLYIQPPPLNIKKV